MRRTGFLLLPHRTTLNQYAGFLPEGSGFKEDVIRHFLEEINVDQLELHQRQCSLLFDEMSIKSGLVYSGHTHKLIGFTEMGSINEEIEAFEKQVGYNHYIMYNLEFTYFCIFVQTFRMVIKKFF